MMESELVLKEGASACWVVREALADVEFEWLHGHIPWRQNAITVYGKEHLEPRLTAWMGPAYRYSSIHWPAQPFTSEVRRMMERAQAHCSPPQPFNACLFNLYRDGRDSMGWHRDNEPEIDPACIASASFGADRDFHIRHRETREKWSVNLRHGDVLVMENLQRDFDHALPKRMRVDEPRINLTFRTLRG
jgi:alkylated DNA repair dioxygenase AlkB